MNRLQLYLTKLINQHRFPMSDWELKNIARNPARLYVKVDKTGMRGMREGGDTASEMSAGKSLMYFCAFEVMSFDRTVSRKLSKLRLDKFTAPVHTPNLDAVLEEADDYRQGEDLKDGEK